jgi:hypothetical protein
MHGERIKIMNIQEFQNIYFSPNIFRIILLKIDDVDSEIIRKGEN